MAVRIYSLAKELNLDSKVLADICAKAGVTGKGSALASLTDEEVDRVKSYLANSSKSAAPREVAAPAAPAVAKPAAVATAAVATASQPSAIRREDYVPPAGVGGKPPVLDAKPPVQRSDTAVRKSTESKGTGKPPAGRVPPTIRVAPMPAAQQPPPKTVAEPEPQKPDIRLPADAIRASRAGGTPLAAHLRKHEAKRKSDASTPDATPAPTRSSRGGADRGGAQPAVPAESKDRRRGGPAKTGVAAEGEAGLAGREGRRLSRRRGGSSEASPVRGGRSEEESRPRRSLTRQRSRRSAASTTAPRKGKVVLQLPCTVRTFSEAVGVRVPQVLSRLLSLGQMANINAELSEELVELLSVELGVELELRLPEDAETQLLASVAEATQADDADESLVPRPPIVTFLGHVDHGKTSLLDRIIGIDVVSGESGGITQHIRAYKINKDGREITFVDTPGHEAFTEMRARGANVTDIAVLVVAADDGVMPQTEEAISHARAAEVPIVVALNKTDLPGVNYDRIYTQLVTSGLQPTEWGGDTELVRTSALTGGGLNDLLETLLTIAELHDYRANPDRQALGTCLEAELHEGRGVVAKVLVQTGTLRVGDVLVCGGAHGRVKAIYDTLNPSKTYEEVGPSTPVNITGLDVAPGAGDRFYVLDDIGQAREIARKRSQQSRASSLGGAPVHVTLESLHERLGSEQLQSLNLILRADVRGSIEAIQKELGKLAHPEVQIKVLQATVGGITEADVHLADASDAIIIGFNVVPDEGARALAQQRGVQIRRYDIIYQVTDDLRAALEGMLKPEQREVELGRALVLRTFSISRVGTIAGCRVLNGTIERNGRVRLIRENRVIGEYQLESLKREKDDAREVREGYECGMKLAGYNDLKEGDVLEVFRIEEFARTL